ncbi:Prolyl endopeptidase, partial [Pseudolycoriella hygida]
MKEPKIIELHGDKICDAYHWLNEDDDKRNKMLLFENYTLYKYLHLNFFKNDWIKAKQKFNNSNDYKLFSDVQHRNWYIFYSYMDYSKGIYEPIFYRTKSLKNINPHVVLDSNHISGTVLDHEYSPNGEYCAFTIWNDDNPSYIQVINVETGECCGRSLKFKRFFKKVLWTKDSKGIFVYYDPREGDKRSPFYHHLDHRKRDIFMMAIKRNETHATHFQLSTNYEYLILRQSQTLSVANVVSLVEKVEFKLIFKILPDVTYDYVGNDGETFLFLTNLDAPKHHIIRVNVDEQKRQSDSYVVVVAENYEEHGVLQSAFKNGDYLFLIYIENFHNSFYLYSLNGQRIEFKIDLKDETFISTKVDEFGFYFQTESYETPQKIYKIDFVQLASPSERQNAYTIVKPILKRAAIVPFLSEEEFSIQHDSFYSFDGSNVPMTVIQQKNNDVNKPCLVFSYGAYGIPMLPAFKLFYRLFIELFNGVVVIIYIRGGGELGDDWLLKSSEAQTSFNDLISGVEYLKRASFELVDSNKIAFHGISHGGCAGAVVINKRRDLFRSVILQNANIDLINDLPSKGRLWAKQYGDLTKKEDYENIKKYAPLLHIEEATKTEDAYPTTLIVASLNDNIVSIVNSLKYIILIKVINTGGHYYETAEEREFMDTVFVKLQFLAQAMDLKFDEKYKKIFETES